MVVDDKRFESGMFGSGEVQEGEYTGNMGWDAA